MNANIPLMLSGLRHKYGDVRGKAFLARARRARRAYPLWVCKERATKPATKRTAARRVALLWAWGVVARRSQPHFGGCSLLAPSPKPKATQRTSPYLCLRPLRPDAPLQAGQANVLGQLLGGHHRSLSPTRLSGGDRRFT